MLADITQDSNDNMASSHDVTLSPLTDDDAAVTRSPRGEDNGPYFANGLGSPLSDPTGDSSEFQEELDFFSNYFDYDGDDALLNGSPDGELEYIPPDSTFEFQLGDDDMPSSSKSSGKKSKKKDKSSKKGKSSRRKSKAPPASPSSPDSVFSIPVGEKILYSQRPWLLSLETEFHAKYWRNDRKNLQCFPLCPEYGNYYRLRMEDLKHTQSGTCKSPIFAVLNCPDGVSTLDIITVVRVSIVDPTTKEPMSTEGELPQVGNTLNRQQVEVLQSNAFPGRLFPVAATPKSGKKGKQSSKRHGQEFRVTFSGDNWKVNMELSKKRRPANDRNKVPLYCVECLVFNLVDKSTDGGQFALVFRGMSACFEIASTRTLLRDVQKAHEKQSSRKKKHEQLDVEQDAQLENIDMRDSNDDAEKRSRKKHKVKPLKRIDGDDEPDDGSLDSSSESGSSYSSNESATSIHSAPARSSTVMTSSRTRPSVSEVENGSSGAIISNEAIDALRKTDTPSAPPSHRHNSADAYIDSSHSDPLLNIHAGRKQPSAPRAYNITDTTSDPSSIQADADLAEQLSRQYEARTDVSINVTDTQQESNNNNGEDCCEKRKWEGWGWWLPPTGIFGAHHFYLDRPVWGVVYMCTFGLFLIGWLIDLFRIPYLVRAANEGTLPSATLGETRLVGLLGGFLGMHRFALGQHWWGIYYFCTLGSLGSGYIMDQFRMGCLYEKQQKEDKRIRDNLPKDGPDLIDCADAYILCVPMGLVGAHHYYMGRYGHGILYTCTLGLFGVGVLRDLFIMPKLVEQSNKEIADDFAYKQRREIELNTLTLSNMVPPQRAHTSQHSGSSSSVNITIDPPILESDAAASRQLHRHHRGQHRLHAGRQPIPPIPPIPPLDAFRRGREGDKRPRRLSHSTDKDLREAKEAMSQFGKYVKGQFTLFKKELMAELNPDSAQREGPERSPTQQRGAASRNRRDASRNRRGASRTRRGRDRNNHFDDDDNVPLAEVV